MRLGDAPIVSPRHGRDEAAGASSVETKRSQGVSGRRGADDTVQAGERRAVHDDGAVRTDGRAEHLRIDRGLGEPQPLVLRVSPFCAEGERLVRRPLKPDRRLRRAEHAGRGGDDPAQHVVDRLGGRQLATELEQRARDLGAFAGALALATLGFVEACVLERDGRVAGQHLQEPHVVFVELFDPELRDDDDADHARAVAERNRDDRLGDAGCSRYLDRVVAFERVGNEQAAARQGDPTRDPLADAALEHLGGLVLVVSELAPERDGQQPVALREIDTSVVVVDERAQLGHDRLSDCRHVRQAVELADEALEHLQVCDRARVALPGYGIGALLRLVSEHDDLTFALRLRGHHRGLGTGSQLARVHGVLGRLCDADRNGEASDGIDARLGEAVVDAPCEGERLREVGVRHDDPELLAPQPADDIGHAGRLGQDLGHVRERVIPRRMPVDVVDPLEVVDVEHEHGDRPATPARAPDLGAKPLVKVPMVEEARERVGLGLVLQPGARLCVVERERRGVAESRRQLELLRGERGLLPEAVDVEGALDVTAGQQGNGDQRLWLVGGGSGYHAGSRIELNLVCEHRLLVLDGPARQSGSERAPSAEDLLRPAVTGHDGHEHPLGLLGPVDREGVVRNEVCKRVGDPVEQRVEALLREHVVEHLREPAIGRENLLGARLPARSGALHDWLPHLKWRIGHAPYEGIPHPGYSPVSERPRAPVPRRLRYAPLRPWEPSS